MRYRDLPLAKLLDDKIIYKGMDVEMYVPEYPLTHSERKRQRRAQPKRFRTPRQRWAVIDDTVDPLASRTSVRGSHREFMESLARYGVLP